MCLLLNTQWMVIMHMHYNLGRPEIDSDHVINGTYGAPIRQNPEIRSYDLKLPTMPTFKCNIKWHARDVAGFVTSTLSIQGTDFREHTSGKLLMVTYAGLLRVPANRSVLEIPSMSAPTSAAWNSSPAAGVYKLRFALQVPKNKNMWGHRAGNFCMAGNTHRAGNTHTHTHTAGNTHSRRHFTTYGYIPACGKEKIGLVEPHSLKR